MTTSLSAHLRVLEEVRERDARYQAHGHFLPGCVPSNAGRAAHDRALLVEACDALVLELERLRRLAGELRQ